MIILTGGNGFIGSNAVARLVGERAGGGDGAGAWAGRAVVVVDDYPSIRGRGAVSKVPREARYNRDLRIEQYIDMNDLPTWLQQSGGQAADVRSAVTGIVHLGACSDTTVTDRDYVMRVNTEYTRTLWRWCAEQGVPLIYASSAATYGDGSAGFDDEADPHRYQPMNLYGESKHAFDLWALEQSAAPPRWAGLKYFNIYGPNEQHKKRMASMAYHWYHQVCSTGIARLFKSYRSDYPDGGQQRDFVYVDDAVDATLNLLTLPVNDQAPNGLYNIGTGEPRTFADLARAVFAALDLEPRLEFIEMPHDLRDQYQYYTCATIAKRQRASLTAQPFHSLERGVEIYIARLLALDTTSAGARTEVSG